MSTESLVRELLDQLGIPGVVNKQPAPSEHQRRQAQPLIKQLLEVAPDQADAWLLAAYCGANKAKALAQAAGVGHTLRGLMTDQAEFEAVALDRRWAVDVPYRVPFLPNSEFVLLADDWVTIYPLTASNLRLMVTFDRLRSDWAPAEAQRVLDLEEDKESYAYLTLRSLLEISRAHWESALETFAKMSRRVTLWSGHQLMQVAASAGLGQMGSAKLILDGIQPYPSSANGMRTFRVLQAMVYGATGVEAAEEQKARALRERLRVDEADSPVVIKLLEQPTIQLMPGTRRDVELRIDPNDPWSRRRDDEIRRAKAYDEAMAEINQLTGLTALREHIETFVRQLRVTRAKEEKLGITDPEPPGHWVFAGPPGTGKTTVARIMAKLLYGVGKIETANVLEVRPADMIGEHLGQTAPRTREVVLRAINGVLFIDEAYQLNDPEGSAGGDKFGREAVTELLALMENHRHNLVVIAAGYPKDMDRLLDTNDGLRSRFNQRLEFASYNASELTAIVEGMAGRAREQLTPEAAAWLESFFLQMTLEDIDTAGNGRLARNVFDAIRTARDHRLNEGLDPNEVPEWTVEELTSLTDRDVRTAAIRLDLTFPQRGAPQRALVDVPDVDKFQPITDAFVGRINDVRAAEGLPPLALADDLLHFAQWRAYEYAVDLSDGRKRLEHEPFPVNHDFSGFACPVERPSYTDEESIESVLQELSYFWTSDSWRDGVCSDEAKEIGIALQALPDSPAVVSLILRYGDPVALEEASGASAHEDQSSDERSPEPEDSAPAVEEDSEIPENSEGAETEAEIEEGRPEVDLDDLFDES